MNSMKIFLQRWWADDRGTITMEFLLWIPLLMFWFMGSVIYFDAFKNRADAGKAAYTISDIVSRQTQISEGYVDQLFALQQRLLPRQANAQQMRVSSIQLIDEETDEYLIQWSESRGADIPPLDVTFLPEEFIPQMTEFDTIVLTEVYVPYVPIADWVGMGAHSWRYALVSRPRFVSSIAMVD